jgi:diguanylate cyclase (GGDEF)-like protein/putative nucleotidyltransferase with HDIG domain/PAS domain S-box-containing protein
MTSDRALRNAQKKLEDAKKEIDSLKIKLQERELLLNQMSSRNRAFFDVFPDILFLYDIDGIFLDCMTNNTSILLFSKQKFIGKNIRNVIPKELAEKAINGISETLLTGKQVNFEYSLTINGELKYFETRMLKSSEKEVAAIVRDVTLQKSEQNLILELSFKDYLTGLYNRRYFEQYLAEIDLEERLPLSILMIDVNGLKLTNDAFGHLLGDALLQRVSEILKSVCPRESVISRIGGDEFAVVLTKYSHEESEQLVDAIYTNIEYERVNNIVVSISIGWETKTTINQLIRDTVIKAENHMFRKKLVESQSMRHQTIKTILETLNTKNERERRHSEQVSKLCRNIGEAMGFNNQIVKEIEMAALLHDIGKITVREELLNKPGKLTDDEYKEIKKHSESGYQILKSVDAYFGLADSVLAHHERYDGKGYPRGLRGKDIPLTARIIAVADAYEAMVSDRAYRKGVPHESAIEEIKRNVETQFDPQIVNVLLRIS